MVYKSTVLYPEEADTKFDLKYYLDTHMPLVASKWKQYGLQGWEVIEHEGSLGGQPSQYRIQATLIWSSKEDVDKAASSSEAKAVFDDVPNFTNKAPIFFSGNEVGNTTI